MSNLRASTTGANSTRSWGCGSGWARSVTTLAMPSGGQAFPPRLTAGRRRSRMPPAARRRLRRPTARLPGESHPGCAGWAPGRSRQLLEHPRRSRPGTAAPAPTADPRVPRARGAKSPGQLDFDHWRCDQRHCRPGVDPLDQVCAVCLGPDQLEDRDAIEVDHQRSSSRAVASSSATSISGSPSTGGTGNGPAVAGGRTGEERMRDGE
jgi:hypothetical protein